MFLGKEGVGARNLRDVSPITKGKASFLGYKPGRELKARFSEKTGSNEKKKTEKHPEFKGRYMGFVWGRGVRFSCRENTGEKKHWGGKRQRGVNAD